MLTQQSSGTLLENIASRSMLVDVATSVPEFVKHDKEVSAEIAKIHGATVEAGRFNKRLLGKDALAPVERARGRVRDEHNKRTLPWRDDGVRILLGTAYMDYSMAVAERITEFEQEANTFCAEYASHRDSWMTKIGTMANLADYPHPSMVRRMFKAEMFQLPFPSSSDFRVSLGEMETKLVQQRMENQILATVQMAMVEPIKRIREAVEHMLHRLKLYSKKKDDGAKGRKDTFRDSLVGNIEDLVKLLPSLNLTGDPEFASLTDRLRLELCTMSADELRQSPEARALVAASAQDILDKMESYI